MSGTQLLALQICLGPSILLTEQDLLVSLLLSAVHSQAAAAVLHTLIWMRMQFLQVSMPGACMYACMLHEHQSQDASEI